MCYSIDITGFISFLLSFTIKAVSFFFKPYVYFVEKVGGRKTCQIM